MSAWSVHKKSDYFVAHRRRTDPLSPRVSERAQYIVTNMAKTIVVCGATGGLGGSVARRMLKEGWQVRGITRNKDSAGAKALVEAGVELASADYDDVASLEAAFQVFGHVNDSP